VVWKKVRDFQDRITREPVSSKEQAFGADSDMRQLAETFLKRVAHLKSGRPVPHRWYRVLRELAPRLVLMEVPMNPEYRELSERSEGVKNVRRWLSGETVVFIPATSFAPMSASDFPDTLHLSRAGARRFSAELGEKLVKL
jgi:hypothetical protein